MRIAIPVLMLAATASFGAELKSGPPLPYRVVEDWAQLPEGYHFGECSGVDVDKDDNVWVFNRSSHPVMKFDKTGKFLEAWADVPVKASHGIRVDPDGNIWAVDVNGHAVMKFTPKGKLLMVIAQPYNRPGNDETKDGFNQPTGINFAPNGDFFVSDGYVNSRVIKFNKGGDYLTHWGSRGKGDSEFDIVHDVALDSRGLLYVADRTNQRVQIFDQDGKFLRKWTGIGAPWGLYYVKGENVIYMCDGLNDRIVKLNMEGQILGVLGSHGKTQGKLDFAHNLAVDSTGAIYVAEIKNWRVQKFVKK